MKCKFSFLLLLTLCVLQLSSCQLDLDEDLKTFLGTLETYEQTKNDVVFLLDESGSIGAANFPHEVLFAELIARLLTVSPDTSRVAVVTFSSGHKTHIDYIKNTQGNNMCTLLRDLQSIGYRGGWTHTRDALIQAGDLLKTGRSNSNRVVILISDGQSNNGDPLPIAKELREKGNIIFAVGVADVNKDELLAIASSPKHIYMLKDFKYIQKVNEQLRDDIKELSWDVAKDVSLCDSFCTAKSDCCDDNANCFCGTRGGRYECACGAGYFGSGHRGECKLCPKGTYKTGAGSDLCKSCPSNSTTLEEGSTTIDDCFCIQGYKGNPKKGEPCVPVECVGLDPPDGGVLIPPKCGNIYNSTCSFKCNEGHCPFFCNKTQGPLKQPWHILPSEPRRCLDTRRWSGEEFHCEKIRCSALAYPDNGNHNCTASEFSFGTTCLLSCNKGYTLQGSNLRTCLMNGSWTGVETFCQVVECPPLKINRFLKVKPAPCYKDTNAYLTACQYFCRKGYKLVGGNNDTELGLRQCQADGTWSNFNQRIRCEDATPPNITCPEDYVYNTDFHKPTAYLSWKLPTASDNKQLKEVQIIHPPHVHKPPHHFQIGKTKVVYQAVDHAELSSTCSFSVIIKDKEPPQVKSCPSDIEVAHEKRSDFPVFWDEPEFEDNSGKLQIPIQNKKSGDLFSWGKAVEVKYSVSDLSGNTNKCTFKVKVKPYNCPYERPPENGFLVCDKSLEGQFCKVSCKDGFDFFEDPEEFYFCSQRHGKGVWSRLPTSKSKHPFKFPWPDCAKKVLPPTTSVNLKLQYNLQSCPSNDEEKENIRKNFIKSLSSLRFMRTLCRTHNACRDLTVRIDCRSLASTRSRRSLSEDKVISINFDVEVPYVVLNENYTCENCTEDSYQNISSILRIAETDISSTLKTAIEEVLPDSSPQPTFIHYELTPHCSEGQVLRKDSCVNCPVGTYYNSSNKSCTRCPLGSFQDSESSLSCNDCPNGTTTERRGTILVKECRATCHPGTYSVTGLQTCIACPNNTYQDDSGQTACKPCPMGSATWTIGSKSVDYCTTLCPVGTFSDTGYQPCIPCPQGSYQPLPQQTSCISCPPGLTTHKEGAHISQYCQVIHFCEELKPCKEGSTCVNVGRDYRCDCPPGLVGKNCEINEDDCSSDICQHGGTCIDALNGYHCHCLPGFTGINCEHNINDCVGDPCLNGGTCIDYINNYICRCPKGFTGKTCDINYYDCASSPCQNGATCFDLKDDFQCCCPKGFTGKLCEKPINKCEDLPCKNGATCVSTLEGFECKCKKGFEGTVCQVNIDECLSNPCLNGGLCVDGVDSFTCNCTPPFTGDLCNSVLPHEFYINFPLALTSNFVDVLSNHHLYAVTVAFWMKTHDKANRGTPLSYAYMNLKTGETVDNALTLLDVNKFVLYIHGKTFRTEIQANRDDLWHHCAVTWDGQNGDWAIYWDAHLSLSGSGVAVGERLWGGHFILGQEQDSLGGGFSLTEAYTGDIAEFNVWDFAMNAEQITTIKKTCGLLGNIVTWPEVKNHIHGNVSIFQDNQLCNDIGECSTTDCLCINQESSLRTLCWKYIPTCSPNPCSNSQLCKQTLDGHYYCECEKGYKGKYCQFDVNECLFENGGCSHMCTNTPGSFLCSCPNDMKLGDDDLNCFATSFCEDGHLVYLNGEKWEKDCQQCECLDGIVMCRNLSCSKVTCKQGEREFKAPGECCSKCIQDPAVCTLQSNNKLVTFDGMEFQFTGTCRYTLSEDCSEGEFTLQLEDSTSRSLGKVLYIYTHCVKVEIFSGGSVKVDGQLVSLPYRNNRVVHVDPLPGEKSAVQVSTQSGVIVVWYPSGKTEVLVPRDFQKKLCGICGNFNGILDDDFTTKQHLPARTVLELIHSWKVDGYKHCKLPKIKPKLFSGPRLYLTGACKFSSFTMQRWAFKACSILRKYTFHQCYYTVDPKPYFQRCLQDACSCKFNEPCFCDAISAYALECRRHKIYVKHWTTNNICEARCRHGKVYDDCGPPCPETCSRVEKNDPKCFQRQCVGGCHCPAGKALHNDHCIRFSKCP